MALGDLLPDNVVAASSDVLIAASHELTRAALARPLLGAGLGCVTAASPGDVRERPLRRLSLAVVALEGDKSAWLDLVENLRRPAVRPHVIVLAPPADGRDIVRAINAGASRFLDMPLDAHALLAAVTKLLREPSELERQVDSAIARAGLTQAETKIARLLLRGATSAEVGQTLGNSEKTIRHHITRIYAKCGVETRNEFCNSMIPF